MTRRLVECRVGERVVVGAVEATAGRVDKLAALGIVPGVELLVQQTRPVVIVESDETVLAIEREIASEIAIAILVEPGRKAAE